MRLIWVVPVNRVVESNKGESMFTNDVPHKLTKIALAGCLALVVSACSSGGGGGDDKEPGTPGGSSGSSGSSSTSSSSSSSSGIAFGDCEDSAATICGDFEDPDQTDTELVNLPDGWKISKSEGVEVSLSSEQSATGDTSIKIVSKGNGYNRGFLTMDLATMPALQEEMFGRMMIYVSAENEFKGDFTFLQAEGSTPQAESGAPEGTDVMYRGRIDGRYDHVFTNYDTWFDGDADNESGWQTDCWRQPHFTDDTPPPQQFIVPKNEWVCMQWHIRKRDNHIDVTMNDSDDMHRIRVYGKGHGCRGTEQEGIWHAPEKFERLHVGIEQYAEDSQPRTVYIDDVIVDSQLVDCQGNLRDPSEH